MTVPRVWTDYNLTKTDDVIRLVSWGQVFCVSIGERQPEDLAWSKLGTMMSNWIRDEYEKSEVSS